MSLRCHINWRDMLCWITSGGYCYIIPVSSPVTPVFISWFLVKQAEIKFVLYKQNQWQFYHRIVCRRNSAWIETINSSTGQLLISQSHWYWLVCAETCRPSAADVNPSWPRTVMVKCIYVRSPVLDTQIYTDISQIMHIQVIIIGLLTIYE